MNRKIEGISVNVGLELHEQEKRGHMCSCRIAAQ